MDGGRLVGVGVEEDGVVVSTASPVTSRSHPGPKSSLRISILARLSSGFLRRDPKSHWFLLRGSSVKAWQAVLAYGTVIIMPPSRSLVQSLT